MLALLLTLALASDKTSECSLKNKKQWYDLKNACLVVINDKYPFGVTTVAHKKKMIEALSKQDPNKDPNLDLHKP